MLQDFPALRFGKLAVFIPAMASENLHRQNIVAIVWDFDKTLISGYMQAPLFRRFGIDDKRFWKEVNTMHEFLAARGQSINPETAYLNHILTYVRAGRFQGLNNAMLRELGSELEFYPGLPEFFQTLKDLVASRREFRKHDIALEHYCVSTGLAPMIEGSAVAPYLEKIYASEFIETPPPPGFLDQAEFEVENLPVEVSQIGVMVDNTVKTRFLFEINKGTNKIPEVDVNSKIAQEDRRVPFANMIYVADGPSDVPAFAVVRKYGGRAYAVYESGNEKEFAQNDALLRTGRVDSYGRADFREKSDTYMWMKTHVTQICEQIVEDCERALARRVARPPRHIHRDDPAPRPTGPQQSDMFEG